MSDDAPPKPNRWIAVLLGVVGPWGLGQLYQGQTRRALVWMFAATTALVAGTFGMPMLGARFGFGHVFAVVVAAMVVLWIGSIFDVLIVPEARQRRASILLILGYWIAGVAVGAGLRVVIRSYGVEAFKVPAGSMMPTLLVGDHFVVDKRTDRTKVPARGDVIVFPFVENAAQDFVKRVIALPGDTLEVKGGRTFLNGWEAPRCRVGAGTLTEAADTRGDVYVEFLDDAAYLILMLDDPPPAEEDVRGPFTVAPGEVWVLGDNRLSSHDSTRWREGQGAGVPIATIKGRFLFRFMSPAPDRFGTGNAPLLPPSLKDLQPALDRCLAERPSRAETTPPPAK